MALISLMSIWEREINKYWDKTALIADKEWHLWALLFIQKRKGLEILFVSQSCKPEISIDSNVCKYL